jgi:hypothetical protein
LGTARPLLDVRAATTPEGHAMRKSDQDDLAELYYRSVAAETAYWRLTMQRPRDMYAETVADDAARDSRRAFLELLNGIAIDETEPPVVAGIPGAQPL